MKNRLSKFFPQRLKNVYHLYQAVLANIWYGFPSEKMVVIGITGTNGKTTTTEMVGAILRQAGIKVAVASTIDFWIGEEHSVNESKFTTLNPWQLQKFLKKALQKGCTHAVIETGSHALDQHRVWGIPYEVAVMTNVTREHLDYHHTMEEYRAAKRRLFRGAKKAVVNLDMEGPEYFIQATKGQVVTYSTKSKEADLFAGGIQLDFTKTEFRIGEKKYSLHIPGLFNIENALAAIGVGEFLDIPYQAVQQGLAGIAGVPGRMELVSNDKKIDIIIDYAVTPDAFEKLYASVLPLKIPGTKIIHVFGACGERDQGKRPILGEIAAKAVDVVILTNEDPYFEDGEQIISDLEKGVENYKKRDKDYFRIYDRRQAITKALSLAEIGDIVLVTGKGAETSMAIGAERLAWSERTVIQEELVRLDEMLKNC
jgi:UDP-N-acetylmuramoyl-L-alanyl-D-glutamate--2,6-diaminopimelate ligase